MSRFTKGKAGMAIAITAFMFGGLFVVLAGVQRATFKRTLKG